ncbi:MAG TPA: 50S ribosomal protein L9 [Caldilineae bacterium]|jgi:large subunit ribosomal protein L9|nr:50S ribosomal protein L9 [Caldilineae bacterium]
MKVMLIQDVEGLGLAGEIKEVAGGYAQHYLIPRGLAIAATKGVMKQAKAIREAAERRRARELNEAQALAEKLNQLTLRFTARAGESDRLYGSITSADIAEAIEREVGQAVDRRHIQLERPIRQLGTHQVSIRLMPNVTAEITVVVEREGGEEEKASSEEAESD